MSDHDAIREQALDYVYGLLTPEEVTEFESRLTADPTLATELEKARQVQELLAQAAKAEFPNVTFNPPIEVPVPGPRPVPSPPREPVRKTMGGVLTRWVMAASLLFAVGAIGIPSARFYFGYTLKQTELTRLERERTRLDQERRETLDRYQVAVAEAQEVLSQRRQQFEQVQGQWFSQLTKADEQTRQQSLYVKVTGPEKLQRGATHDIEVETLSRDHRAVPANVKLALLDADGKEVYSRDDTTQKGPVRIQLGEAFWASRDSSREMDYWLKVVAERDGVEQVVDEKISFARSVDVTHLITDKPMYRPGERVRFRAVTLDRSTLMPPEQSGHFRFRITAPDGSEVFTLDGTDELIDEKTGEKILGPDGTPVHGLACGEFALNNAIGGEYRLTVSRLRNRLDARAGYVSEPKLLAEKTFLVNVYRQDRLNKKLEFDGKSYGPGDSVLAKCDVSLAEGGRRVFNVVVRATVDGQPVKVPERLKTDPEGVVWVSFKLPEAIQSEDANLSVTFDGGGVRETISRPIPVITKDLTVEFYPEGGDLVEGVPCRVYYAVRTRTGKPADLEGVIMEGDQEITRTRTLTDKDYPGVNQGLGVFTLTPEAGKKYHLQVERPRGVSRPFALPQAKPDGVVMEVSTGVSRPGEPITLTLRAGLRPRDLLVGAYCRGNLLDQQRLTIKPEQVRTVELKPDTDIGGVVRVTVFEERGDADEGQARVIPVTERLVYRHPGRTLELEAKPTQKRYNPGDAVELSLLARNEKDEPQPAVCMLAVVNQSIITMADDKTERMLPAALLLAGEVRNPEELEFADFLIDRTGPDHGALAEQTLDLLLGTQGWRRFAEVKPDQVPAQSEAARLLTAIGQTSRTPTDTLFAEHDRINQAYVPKVREVREVIAQAEQSLAEVHSDQEFTTKVNTLSTQLQDAEIFIEVYRDDLVRYREARIRTLSWALPSGSLVLLVIGFVGMMIAMQRERKSGWIVLSTLCLISGFGLLVALAFVPFSEMSSVSRETAGMEGKVAAGMAAEGGVAGDMAEMDGMDAPIGLDSPEQFDGENGMMMAPAPPGFGGVPDDDAVDKANRFVAPLAAPGMPIPQIAKPAAAADQQEGQGARRGLRPGMVPMRKEAEAGEQFRDRGLREKDALGLERAKKADVNGRQPLPGRQEQPMEELAEGKPKLIEEAPDPMIDMWMAVPGELPGNAMHERVAEGFGALAALDGRRMRQLPLEPPAPFFVREYAQVPKSDTDHIRSDFTETVLWQPVVVVPSTGQVVIEPFGLADEVTRYRVLVSGHTLDGRLGAVTTEIEARKPFSLDPKLPLEISSNDRIDVPLLLTNDSPESRKVRYRLTPDGLEIDGSREGEITLSPEERTRRGISLRPGRLEGGASLQVNGTSIDSDATDSVRRELTIVPDGFPISGAYSDLIENVARTRLTLPADLVPGTLAVKVEAYPSTLAELQQGLAGLLREPSGCFEQSSTTNYPNVLILDYLEETDQAEPEVRQRARQLLDNGYQKLTSFECQKPDGDGRRGYEWFGGTAPPHEALTAYGLLQFRDMAQVYPVDAEMLQRTQQYLINQRDGKGGFKRNARALDSFGGAPQDITDAYIVWALTESDPDNTDGLDLSKEIDSLKERAKSSKDSYFLALVANALLNRDDHAMAVELLQRITEQQQADGHVSGAETSITRSGGQSLQIETTALAMLGWLKSNRQDLFAKNTQDAVKWIGQQRSPHGAFGSTQSTILALKALIEFTRANKKPAESGTLRLFVADQLIGEKSFTEQDVGPIAINVANPETVFKPGEESDVRIELTTKEAYPFTLGWECRTRTPESAEDVAVRLETVLDQTTLTEGDTAQLRVTLRNLTDKEHGMTTAIVGLPGGMKLPEDMKELKKLIELPEDGSAPRLGFFELRGTRELILYWRSLAPEQEINLNLTLIANVPGQYRGPASRGYLYYNPDHKHWVEPLAVTITPKREVATDR